MADCPVCGNKAKVYRTIPISTGKRKEWYCKPCDFKFTGEAVGVVKEIIDPDCLVRAEEIRKKGLL